MDRKTLFNGSFFILLALMLYLAARLLLPSCGALLAAAVLAVVFYPVHQWLGRHISNTTLRALISDLFVITFFFVPVGWLVWAAIAQSDAVIPIIRPAAENLLRWAQSAPHDVLDWVAGRFPWLAEHLNAFSAALQNYLSGLAHRSIALLARLGAQAAQLVWHVFLAVVALFFFFRDGETLAGHLNRLLPLRAEVKTRIAERIRRMVIGAARGAIFTSLAQGLAATVGFLVLRAPFAFLLGFLTMIVAVIPVIGSALIWAPISFYYFWSGAYWKGAFLLVWGLLVIGLIDNLLRPWLIGIKQDISFFWLFFSLVGGLQVFGLFGVLIGPLVMAIVVILLDIYQHVYLATPGLVSPQKDRRPSNASLLG